MELDVSMDDASRKPKSDGDEPITAINESVFKIEKSFNDVVPVPIAEKSLNASLSKGEGRILELVLEMGTMKKYRRPKIRKKLNIWPISSNRIMYVEKILQQSK